MGFAPAVRTAAHLRIGISGPTGAGKTYTGIRLGLLLAQPSDGKLAVIDTEEGSASLYQGIEAPDGIPWDFDVCGLGPGRRSPENYTDALKDAARAKYPVVLVDSLSHAWADMLAQVDRKASQSKDNSFTAWRTVTPQHTALIDGLLAYPGHVIFTVRSKMAYELVENDRGKKEPVKIGLAPVFRDGLEYESTVWLEADTDHNIRVGKTRISALDGLVLNKPGPGLARPMLDFLNNAPPPPPPPKTAPDMVEAGKHHPSFTKVDGAKFAEAIGKLGVTYDALAAWLEAGSPNAMTVLEGLELPPSRPSQWAHRYRVALFKLIEKDAPAFIRLMQATESYSGGGGTHGD